MDLLVGGGGGGGVNSQVAEIKVRQKCGEAINDSLNQC